MNATTARLYRLCAPQLAALEAEAALAALAARVRQDATTRSAA